MAERISLKLCWGDLLAVGLIVLMIVGIFAFFSPRESAEGAVVQVYLDGELVREAPLDADAQFSIVGKYENVISISGGRASIIESDCPGDDCVHSGSIGAVGRSIVCLPNRLEVRIVGASPDEVDMIVG